MLTNRQRNKIFNAVIKNSGKKKPLPISNLAEKLGFSTSQVAAVKAWGTMKGQFPYNVGERR